MTLISDSFKNTPLPENMETLTGELEQLLRLVNNAIIPSHLNASEKFLHNFARKWSLGTAKQPDTIITAIEERITAKRIEWQIQDSENADNARIKRAA